MTDAQPTSGTRFGRTVIAAAVGELVEQPVQAIIYPANSRGVMGAGPAGSVRTAAGPDVEREAMAQAPVDLGAAIVTGPGRLHDRGIEAILHAVIARALGDVPRLETVVRALRAALRLADERRLHTVALPVLGVSAEAPAEERASVAQALVDAIVAHVRRPGARFERIVIVSRFDDDLPPINQAIARARERSWISPA